MPKGIGKGKKLIAVSAELVSELNKLANKKGVLFSKYINDILMEAVRAEQAGQILGELVDLYEVIEMRKASGCVMVPRDVLSWLIKKLHPKEKDELQNVWLNAGRWFGRLLKVKFGRKAFDFFIKILRLSEWEVEEVSLEHDNNIIKLQLISFTLSEENTNLLMCYVEGVMESLGIKIEKKEHIKGVISLKLRRTIR